MGKFGPYNGGGGNNMQALMKQAQMMQQQALKAQKEVEETEITGESAGGMVKIVLTGDKKPVSVSISEEAIDDVEMLEDLVLVALKDASDKADKLKEDKMGGLGGGLF